ncbi:DUF4123 domain-containing protein [Lonsdalea quercina]|uniref:DUF4123 domain-containing protein n=1 Tax=Lonsdalea quercina TaxID=71657 RepID=UPI0005689BFA|nr:DUF4123 domain-containing protein [Lonsdalea quercina]
MTLTTPLTTPFLTETQEDADGWLARIDEGGCFIVAEAALNDAAPWLAERWGGSLEHTRLYWGEAGREHASISPYCIPVTAQNWPQLEEYLCIRDGWGIGIQLEWFMQAYTPGQQLVELVTHLRHWSLVAMPDGDNAILRISDWLIVKQLLSASTAQEATALFGPIASFCDLSPNRGGSRVLTLTHREPHDIPNTSPRQLSDAQWQALLGPSTQNALETYMDHLRAYHPRWQAEGNDALLAFTQQQVKQAELQGFNNDRDIVRYLALATELSPDFIGEPWAQTVMAEPEIIGTQNKMDRLYAAAVSQQSEA